MEGGGFGVVFVQAISRRKAKEGDGKRKKWQSLEKRVGAPQKFKGKNIEMPKQRT